MNKQNSTIEKAKNHIKKLIGNHTITKKNGKYILDFVEQLEAQGHSKGPYSKNRIRKYIYGLGSISKIYEKDFDKTTKENINNLASKIREKYEKETARDYLVILRLFIKYIWEQKGNEYEDGQFPDIIKKIKPGNRQPSKVKRTELLTTDDIEKLANHTNNLRDRCFVIMLYESGCRISEIIGDETHPGILLKDIKFDQYGVIVDVDGKTGQRSLRLIATGPAISNWLQEHPDKDNQNAPLFCAIWGNKKGQRIGYQYWKNMLTGKTDNRKRKNDKKIPMLGLGEKAGINKPMHPHHFRHSRASELAKHFTESQLCYFMGWEQGSKQARIYVHLSGRDTESAILKMYGRITEEEKEEQKITPIICPRCNKENDPFAKYCSACSLLLDEKSIANFEKEKEQASKLGLGIMNTAGLEDSIGNMLLKKIQEMEEKIKSLEQS